MIYTIGFKEKYDELFERSQARDEPFLKVGRKDGYQGGSVWPTQAQAEAHLAENPVRLKGYAVYGVEAVWERDTAPNADASWEDLLIDAPLVKLT